MKKLALIISTLFEPMIVLYVLAIIGGKHANLTTGTWPIYIAILTIFFVVVFVIRLFFKRKDHTNWDISERKKRFWPLLFLIVFISMQFGAVHALRNPILTSMFLLMLLWVIGFFLLTLFVKLSGHLSILTLAICQLIAWYGMKIIPFILLIPLLSWSRIVLKRHSPSEVVLGVTYSGLLFFVLHFGFSFI